MDPNSLWIVMKLLIRLAKDGVKGVQIDQDLGYLEKRTLIKSSEKVLRLMITLTREEQVILAHQTQNWPS